MFALLPRKVWFALGAALALALLWRLGVEWHSRQVENLRVESYKKAEGAFNAQSRRLTDMAVELKLAADKLSAASTAAERVQHARASQHIDDRAAQLLRGGPKVQCGSRAQALPDLPRLPGPAAGALAQSALDDRLAGVPWDELTQFSRSHDQCFLALRTYERQWREQEVIYRTALAKADRAMAR